MNFIKQIGIEIKNILRSKFILIIGILVLVVSVALPLIGLINRGREGNPIGPMPIGIDRAYNDIFYDKAYDVPMEEEPIIIDGVTIKGDNPFYWEIWSIKNEMDNIEMNKEMFSKPEIMDLALSMMETELKYYVKFAEKLLDHRDYRYDLSWVGIESLYDKFIYEHHEVSMEEMLEAIQFRRGYDEETYKAKYVDITSEERLKAIELADENLKTVFEIIDSNDFPKYIEFRINQEKKSIDEMEKQIELQEELIVKNPLQEDNINTIIEDIRKQIEHVETNTIPMLQYRLEKNIIPGEDRWENVAIINIEENRARILYEEIIDEEEFRKEHYLVQQYGTYQKYVKAIQEQIDKLNNEIIIAQKSLDAGKPDMKYAYTGARYKTVEFLTYSAIVSIFGILLGGWLIASEFQQGTIRLLMIRPKTRTKILMSKFLGALILTFVIYIVGSFLNAITNGIVNGFSDFKYPNYTIGGEVNFWAYYLPKLLASSISVIFAYITAFMFSVLLKNVAVAMIIPIIGFISSFIIMETFPYRNAMKWIAYTPAPFAQISSFFLTYSPIKQAAERGITISLAYGIGLLALLSAIFMALSIVIFKRRDITN